MDLAQGLQLLRSQMESYQMLEKYFFLLESIECSNTLILQILSILTNMVFQIRPSMLLSRMDG
jgi:hypothetical protein